MSHDKDIINEEARRFYEEGFTENVYGRPTFDGFQKIALSKALGWRNQLRRMK